VRTFFVGKASADQRATGQEGAHHRDLVVARPRSRVLGARGTGQYVPAHLDLHRGGSDLVRWVQRVAVRGHGAARDVEETEEDIRGPLPVLASPMRVDLFEGHRDVLGFLDEHVPLGWTRVLLVDGGGWEGVVVPIAAPGAPAADA
jgi:hypothetical protein